MNPFRPNSEDRKSNYFLSLIIGGTWNIIFGALGVFNLPFSNSLFFKSITPESALVANHTWWLVVMLAGIGYGIVALRNDKFRFFITLGAIGKVAFFVLIALLWMNSIATDLAIVVAIVDLGWAIFFCYFLYDTRVYGML